MINSTKCIHPIVYWGQSEEYVFLSIKVANANVDSITINQEEFMFSAMGTGADGVKKYEFSISYYLPIIPEESRYVVTSLSVNVKLRKELKDSWSRLTLGNQRLPWVRSDFDRYQFNDSDLENNEEECLNVNVVHPSKEERDKHNEEQMMLIDAEEWEAFLNLIKNPLTIYLFIFNVVQFSGYLYVCGALVYGLMQYKEVHKIPFYEWTIDRLVFVQILSILEPLHAFLGWIRGGSILPVVFQLFGRSFVLFCIVLPHAEFHSASTTYWLFFSWSLIEVVRYPYYILSLLSFQNGLITYLRHTLWIILYPIGFICEGKLIIRSLPLLIESRKFCLELPNSANVSFDFTTFLQIYMFSMSFGLYYNMRHLYLRRRKIIGPRPIKGADQMGYLSFIPFLRSLVHGSKMKNGSTTTSTSTIKKKYIDNRSSLPKLN
ncbi:putative butyrate induced transcript [Schistosoma mansoni]|uniref:putative butyrate induced transcript n=1 Tax=Schistosoma mansoni TaxID=6183 RepID=UPI0001A626EB|nr:putative butyrate induced transcript [Schistosoma mansoni]|eukprot:XP_018650672.1 putative butyrate induced transcript [Schistosoma mansoni]